MKAIFLFTLLITAPILNSAQTLKIFHASHSGRMAALELPVDDDPGVVYFEPELREKKKRIEEVKKLDTVVIVPVKEEVKPVDGVLVPKGEVFQFQPEQKAIEKKVDPVDTARIEQRPVKWRKAFLFNRGLAIKMHDAPSKPQIRKSKQDPVRRSNASTAFVVLFTLVGIGVVLNVVRRV